MIINRLVINNFRQYVGCQEVVFATGTQKNVTLIHGENGFGKTCFLNALLWGFYGRDGLSQDLPTHEHILPDSIRETCQDPHEAQASVQIMFSHGDETFTLSRSITLADEAASEGKDTTIELAIRQTDGQTLRADGREAQRIIDQMLPRDLRELLFFNGENIDHFAMEENAEQVRKAARGLLGLQLLEQTLQDLVSSQVRGELRKKLGEYSDDETRELIERESQLENKLKTKRDDLSTCRLNQSACSEKISAIKSKLESNKEARDLQRHRDALDVEKDERERTLQTIKHQLSELIANDGYSMLCGELVAKGRQISHRLRAEGRIPARVMNDFIHDLLKAHRCICGTSLPDGSEEWRRVEEQLTKAGDPEFNRAVGDLDKAIGSIEGAIPRTREALERLTAAWADQTKRLLRIREDLEEIKEKLGSTHDEEVLRLEAQLEAEQLRRNELLIREGSLLKEIEELDKQRKETAELLKAKHQKREEAQRAQRRFERLEEVVELLQNLLNSDSEDLRAELDAEIRKIFSRISLHDYTLSLTEDFTLKLTKFVARDGGVSAVPVATSAGQRQVMSLVFIASLVSLAKRRNEIAKILKDVQGGDYLVAMDAPFDKLGGEFTSAVARYIPELAPQVVLLIFNRHFLGEVEQELGASKRVGRQYYLRYHAPKKRPDAAAKIRVANKEYVVFQEDDIEHTEIIEIE